MEKIFINVPYAEKEDAKSKGAKWDPQKKSWFILDDMNNNLFSKWIFSDKEKYNCTELLHPVFLVKSKEPCWRCAGISDVYCLAASGFINSDFEHDEFSTFSNIKVLSGNLARVLKIHAPKYNQDYSQKAGSVYYMNHCQYCNAKLGDFYMHNEPGGAFQPLTPTEGKGITLFEIKNINDECYLHGNEGLRSPCYIESDAQRAQI